MDRRRHGDDDTRPKVCRKCFRKEDYVDYVCYSLIASVQKFLVERVEDEDVTELMTPVRTFSISGRTTWITRITS